MSLRGIHSGGYKNVSVGNFEENEKPSLYLTKREENIRISIFIYNFFAKHTIILPNKSMTLDRQTK